MDSREKWNTWHLRGRYHLHTEENMSEYKYSMWSLPQAALLGLGWAFICILFVSAAIADEPVEVDRTVLQSGQPNQDETVLISGITKSDFKDVFGCDENGCPKPEVSDE